MKLYHVAGFVPDAEHEIIVLRAGTQNAAGIGVYFSEVEPLLHYAGGERNSCVWNEKFIVVFEIDSDNAQCLNFFRAKNKRERVRYRHSAGKEIHFLNSKRVEEVNGKACRIYDKPLSQ